MDLGFLNICHVIGQSPLLVQGGGGNVSVKLNPTEMLIKASGCFLSEVNEESGFVKVNYARIVSELESLLRLNESELENDKFNEFINSKSINLDFGQARPSIETGFHAVLGKYVIHSHSLYANIFNCLVHSEKESLEVVLKDVFKDIGVPLLVDYKTPGLELTLAVYAKTRQHPNNQIIFLKNHGLIVSGENEKHTLSLHNHVNQRVAQYFDLEEFFKDLQGNIADPLLMIEQMEVWVEEMSLPESDIFHKVLFPDQTIYLKEGKVKLDNQQVLLQSSGEKEKKCILETLWAYLAIRKVAQILGLSYEFISTQESQHLNQLKSEKYRQNLINDSEVK